VTQGNSLDLLRELPADSVDSCVTDPPYELGFMGKKWDASGIAYSVELWREVMRVLKPGGHLLAFGGTRTHHRMVCAIEDAGFEIRDEMQWIYGSGFPKSLDVSKAIDKVNGETGRLLKFVDWMRTTGLKAGEINAAIEKSDVGSHYLRRDQPAIPTVALWEKLRPLCGDVPAWVDELVERIEAEREVVGNRSVPVGHAFAGEIYGGDSSSHTVNITAPATPAARKWQGWGTALKPANEPICVARKPLIGTVAENVLEYGTGAINVDAGRVESDVPVQSSAGKGAPFGPGAYPIGEGRQYQNQGRWPANVLHDGSDEVLAAFGDAARFFYCAKASRRERDAGCEDERNGHPTVKPLALMQYLVRLVTPQGGTVLDPFTGSGTTGAAALESGCAFIGFELNPEYCEIANRRIEAAAPLFAEVGK